MYIYPLPTTFSSTHKPPDGGYFHALYLGRRITMPENTIDPTEFLTTVEAAHFLKLQPQTLIAYANGGRIRAAFFGRRWKFLKADLVEFAAENRRGKR